MKLKKEIVRQRVGKLTETQAKQQEQGRENQIVFVTITCTMFFYYNFTKYVSPLLNLGTLNILDV